MLQPILYNPLKGGIMNQKNRALKPILLAWFICGCLIGSFAYAQDANDKLENLNFMTIGRVN